MPPELSRYELAKEWTVTSQKGVTRLFMIFLTCLSCSVQAQTSAPKPDSEFNKLQVLVGHWTFTGEYKSGSWGQGAKITGDYTFHLLLKGFVLEARLTERSTHAATHYLEIDAYDPVKRSITFSEYSDASTSYCGVVNIDGRTIIRNGTVTASGKQFPVKETLLLSADGKSATVKGELSSDGKNWLPYFEAKLTRMESAAK